MLCPVQMSEAADRQFVVPSETLDRRLQSRRITDGEPNRVVKENFTVAPDSTPTRT